MAFNLLRKEKAVEILLTLLKGAKGVRELQRAVGGSYKTIYERIKEFLEAELIKEEYVTDETFGPRPYDPRLIRLSEEGRKLAQSIVDSGFAKPLLLRKFRERWDIAVLHVLKTVSGRTRFMKLLFLSQKECGFTKRELTGFYRFRAGKYGPFSRGLKEDLDELQHDKFITIEVKSVGPDEFSEEQKFLHVYRLVSEQTEVVQEALDNLPHNAIQRLEKLKTFNRMPLMDLLEYVYRNYPDYIKKSIIVEKILHNKSRTFQ